jgi:hypothetical protein
LAALEAEHGKVRRVDAQGVEASSVFMNERQKGDSNNSTKADNEAKMPNGVEKKMEHFEKKGFLRRTRFIDEYERDRFLG